MRLFTRKSGCPRWAFSSVSGRASRILRAAETVTMAISSLLRAVLLADHELQPRPFLVHGADLHVHESQRQGDLANGVFRDVGGDLGGLLGPGYPDRGVVAQLGKRAGQCRIERGAAGTEHMKDVGAAAQARGERDFLGQGSEKFQVVAWRVPRDHVAAGLDAELLR